MGQCVCLRRAIKGRQVSLNVFGLTLPPRREGKWGLHTVISPTDIYRTMSRATEDSKSLALYSFCVSTENELAASEGQYFASWPTQLYGLTFA